MDTCRATAALPPADFRSVRKALRANAACPQATGSTAEPCPAPPETAEASTISQEESLLPWGDPAPGPPPSQDSAAGRVPNTASSVQHDSAAATLTQQGDAAAALGDHSAALQHYRAALRLCCPDAGSPDAAESPAGTLRIIACAASRLVKSSSTSSRDAGRTTGEQQVAQLHLKCAACCQQTGALGRALAHCTAALSLLPHAQGAVAQRVAALARRADLLEALERFGEGASDLREALSLDPGNKLVSLFRQITRLVVSSWRCVLGVPSFQGKMHRQTGQQDALQHRDQLGACGGWCRRPLRWRAWRGRRGRPPGRRSARRGMTRTPTCRARCRGRPWRALSTAARLAPCSDTALLYLGSVRFSVIQCTYACSEVTDPA